MSFRMPIEFNVSIITIFIITIRIGTSIWDGIIIHLIRIGIIITGILSFTIHSIIHFMVVGIMAVGMAITVGTIHTIMDIHRIFRIVMVERIGAIINAITIMATDALVVQIPFIAVLV